MCRETEIDLDRMDIMGKLLTENEVVLESGLTVIQSKLGWTVIEKQNLCKKDSYITSLSIYVKNASLNELW